MLSTFLRQKGFLNLKSNELRRNGGKRTSKKFSDLGACAVVKNCIDMQPVFKHTLKSEEITLVKKGVRSNTLEYNSRHLLPIKQNRPLLLNYSFHVRESKLQLNLKFLTDLTETTNWTKAS